MFLCIGGGSNVSSLGGDDSDFVPGEESDEDNEFDGSIWKDKEDNEDEENDEYPVDGYQNNSGEEEMESLTRKMGSVGLKKNGKPQTFSVDEKNTWLVYEFEHNDRQYCCADVLVLTMGRDKFRPRVSKTGNNVIIELVKPKFFFGYQRLELVNQNNSSFDGNTHKATAFKKALRTMRKELGTKKRDEVVGDDLVIPLPFKCEEDIVEWKTQVFTNKDEEIVKKIRSVQLYSVLSMTFVSVEKLEDNEKEASFSVFSPESKRRKKYQLKKGRRIRASKVRIWKK